MLSPAERARREAQSTSPASGADWMPERAGDSRAFGPCQHPGCGAPFRYVGVDGHGRPYLSSNCSAHAVRDA